MTSISEQNSEWPQSIALLSTQNDDYMFPALRTYGL